MQCEMATVNSDKDMIKEIFDQTKTIAIVGLSPNEEKDSNKVAKYLQDNGFVIIPIYPKEETILGQKVYRSLLDIPTDIKIDMVDIFRKPAIIKNVVEACIQRGGIDTVWSQLGLVNNEAMQIAKDHGMNAVQNLCTKIEHRNLYKK
jgi:predicted CoA-binding protein